MMALGHVLLILFKSLTCGKQSHVPCSKTVAALTHSCADLGLFWATGQAGMLRSKDVNIISFK